MPCTFNGLQLCQGEVGEDVWNILIKDVTAGQASDKQGCAMVDSYGIQCSPNALNLRTEDGQVKFPAQLLVLFPSQVLQQKLPE